MWLRRRFPGRPEMQVSHETICQSIYVQGRGALRRELAACLRTGRALRKPRRKDGEQRGRIPGMVMISERPGEVQDRAVPGHWEGDLIAGTRSRSAIGTLAQPRTPPRPRPATGYGDHGKGHQPAALQRPSEPASLRRL
jgi:IS30 family transposase